jgi:hypothetical protein
MWHTTRPSHSSWFDQPNDRLISCGVQIMELHLMQFRRVPCYLLLSGPNIIRTLYSSTADLYSFVDMRNHVSHSNTPAKLWFRIFHSLYYWIANGKWRVYGHNGSRTTQTSHVVNFVTHSAFIFKGLWDIDVWPLSTNQLQRKRRHIPEGRSPLNYNAVPFTAYVL